MRQGHEHDPVYGITTAHESHSADITRRQKQYVYTMLFRVVSIVVVVWVPGLTVWERVILGLIATVIPFFAVVRANGGPEPDADPTNLMLGAPDRPSIAGPQTELPEGARIFRGETAAPRSQPEPDRVPEPEPGIPAAAAAGPDPDGLKRHI